MPDPTESMTASIVYDRNKYPSVTLRVELQDLSGNLLVVGSPQGSLGPIVGSTGPLPAGDYRLRVALTAGGPLPAYTAQLYSALAFKSGEFQPWTLNRPINVPVNIKGGVPPYVLTVLSPFKKPDGLILDGVNGRVIGSPTGPQAPDPPIAVGGSFTYSFLLSAQDAATPPNTASGTVAFTVNDFMRDHSDEFVAFPWNKSVSRPCPFTGGTAPFAFTVDEGTLPEGLEVGTVPRLAFTGTPTNPGSTPLKLVATDVAASTATADVTTVVCVPSGTTGLALGAAACGFYVDALQGSTVAVTVVTQKKQPSRLLRALVLDSDGFTPVEGGKLKVGKGKASLTGFVAPHTGRFYFVVASGEGDATRLTGTTKVALPKTVAGGSDGTVSPGDAPVVVSFSALEGATLTFTVKPDKSGAQWDATYIISPNDEYVALDDADLKFKGGGFSFTRTLDVSGDWRVLVVAKPGASGTFTSTAKLKQPKGAYAVD
jgi:hypothetical protein